MNFHEVRKNFSGLSDKTFLDAACISLIPNTSKDEISSFLNKALSGPTDDASSFHIYMDEKKAECRKNAALLLNAPLRNVSLVESTTHGLNIACNALNFNEDDEVIIGDTEYLQVAIPFIKKQQQRKLTVVKFRSDENGLFSLNELKKIISKKTKAICLSSVQWCTGQRFFSQELSNFCKKNDIWLIIDGVQELGCLDVDLTEKYCDFYVAGGHKWLNAPFGCGIMYMSDKALQLQSQYSGYLNLPAPEGGWGAYFQDPKQTPFREYNFVNEAISFAIGGTGNYPGAIGLNESIKLILKIGKKNIENQSLGLSELLRKELVKNNITVKKLIQEEQSGITIFSVFDNPEKDKKALDYLLNNKIYLSIRYTNGHGGLRASTHYFNNEADVGNLINALCAMKRKI